MNINTEIAAIVTDAAGHFASAAAQFRPYRVREDGSAFEGVPERNLTFYVAHAFLGRNPSGHALMELAFKRKDTRRADRHLDAYLFTDKIGLMVESKQVYDAAKVAEIKGDVERLSGEDLHMEVLSRHNVKPTSMHAVVFADAWRNDHVRWWTGEHVPSLTWERPTLGWTHGSLLVHKFRDGSNGSLYWLWAVSPELPLPTATPRP
jgi:hypothetical protein